MIKRDLLKVSVLDIVRARLIVFIKYNNPVGKQIGHNYQVLYIELVIPKAHVSNDDKQAIVHNPNQVNVIIIFYELFNLESLFCCPFHEVYYGEN